MASSESEGYVTFRCDDCGCETAVYFGNVVALDVITLMCTKCNTKMDNMAELEADDGE